MLLSEVMKTYKLTREDKTIASLEDWYPTINNEVTVSFLQLSDGKYRVCVWGGDDFGLEKDFPRVECWQARLLYNYLTDFTSQHQMKQYGMYPA